MPDDDTGSALKLGEKILFLTGLGSVRPIVVRSVRPVSLCNGVFGGACQEEGDIHLLRRLGDIWHELDFSTRAKIQVGVKSLLVDCCRILVDSKSSQCKSFHFMHACRCES